MDCQKEEEEEKKGKNETSSSSARNLFDELPEDIKSGHFRQKFVAELAFVSKSGLFFSTAYCLPKITTTRFSFVGLCSFVQTISNLVKITATVSLSTSQLFAI